MAKYGVYRGYIVLEIKYPVALVVPFRFEPYSNTYTLWLGKIKTLLTKSLSRTSVFGGMSRIAKTSIHV